PGTRAGAAGSGSGCSRAPTRSRSRSPRATSGRPSTFAPASVSEPEAGAVERPESGRHQDVRDVVVVEVGVQAPAGPLNDEARADERQPESQRREQRTAPRRARGDE